MNNVLLTGKWSDNMSWELIELGELTDDMIVTSVFGIVVIKNQILLTKTKRNEWEPAGGHVEKEESINEALERELLEEGGVSEIIEKKLWATIKVHNKSNEINVTTGELYPEVGHILMYFVRSNETLVEPTDTTTVETKLFGPEEIKNLDSSNRESLLLAVEKLRHLGWIK